MSYYPTPSSSVPSQRGHFWAGLAVMFVGHLVLSAILPFFGGLIAGLIGGKIVGSSRRALLAAMLPLLVFVVISFFLPHLVLGPIGAIVGLAVGFFALIWAILNSLGLLIGAYIGGAL